MRIYKTSDTAHAEEVMKKIKANDGHCPCKLEKTKDTLCMCREFREMDEGTCHCGLFTKEK